jgi:hypothetical protein
MRETQAVSACIALIVVSWSGAALAQDDGMSFFLTSVGGGDGANLGGIRGADRHCQELAEETGAGDRTWHAYLSLTSPAAPINARDRIGTGPWYNARGVLVAHDVLDLHSDSNNLTKETALDENGDVVNGSGDEPNTHDVLTGSRPDGTAWPYDLIDLLNLNEDDNLLTCGNWTNNTEAGSAMVGHHDRSGQVGYSSWNSAHPSIGCSQQSLVNTGGAGLFYCFAIN